MSKGYLVTWTMVLHEDGSDEITPGMAAEDALFLLRDPQNVTTVFEVQRILSTAPSDGRPLSLDHCGMFDGATGELAE